MPDDQALVAKLREEKLTKDERPRKSEPFDYVEADFHAAKRGGKAGASISIEIPVLHWGGKRYQENKTNYNEKTKK
jgi:hypothetical protein